MRRVLAVGAHPDDIELGCGATLLAHSAAGDAVTMLVMTGGENGPGDDEAIVGRRLEQEQAARTLGAGLLWGGQLDCAVTPDAATVAVVERAIKETDADLVYVHAPDDSHQDHRAVAAATLSAARRLSRVLHYQSPSTLTFSPTTFVDVTAYLSASSPPWAPTPRRSRCRRWSSPTPSWPRPGTGVPRPGSATRRPSRPPAWSST